MNNNKNPRALYVKNLNNNNGPWVIISGKNGNKEVLTGFGWVHIKKCSASDLNKIDNLTTFTDEALAKGRIRDMHGQNRTKIRSSGMKVPARHR